MCDLRERHANEKTTLEVRLRSADAAASELKQQCSQLGEELKHAFDKHEEDDRQITAMKEEIEALTANTNELRLTAQVGDMPGV